MKTAHASDWRTHPIPPTHVSIQLDRIFSAEEISDLRRGFLPEEMEDKWFIYWQDDTLYFHRSWTGFCIFVAHFHYANDEWHLIGAEVNGDPEQYQVSSDLQESKMINYLIDLLLLRRDVPFPSEGRSPEESTMLAWGCAGRAILGQFPEDDSDVNETPKA